jgi:hypothetical protein
VWEKQSLGRAESLAERKTLQSENLILGLPDQAMSPLAGVEWLADQQSGGLTPETLEQSLPLPLQKKIPDGVEWLAEKKAPQFGVVFLATPKQADLNRAMQAPDGAESLGVKVALLSEARHLKWFVQGLLAQKV